MTYHEVFDGEGLDHKQAGWQGAAGEFTFASKFRTTAVEATVTCSHHGVASIYLLARARK